MAKKHIILYQQEICVLSTGSGPLGEMGFCPNCTSIFHFSKLELNTVADHGELRPT